MGGGDKQSHHHAPPHIPKGCVAVMVGRGEEEEQKFVIPVTYLKHPLFLQLLKEAEEEYGFGHDGPIKIPRSVEEFRRVQGVIEGETARHHGGGHHSWCFKN